MGSRPLRMPCEEPGCKAQVWIRTRVESSLNGDRREVVDEGDPYCSAGHTFSLGLNEEAY